MRDGFFGELGFVPRVIEFDEDEVISDSLLERVVLEDFFVQFDAPTAPVRAGEIDKEIFVFSGSLLFSGFDVMHPALASCEGG